MTDASRAPDVMSELKSAVAVRPSAWMRRNALHNQAGHPARANTGLVEMSLLHRQVALESRAKVHSGVTAMILIAFDDLEAIDRRLGSDVGDEVRAVVAQRIVSQLHHNDLAAELDSRTIGVLVRATSDIAVLDTHQRLVEVLAEPMRIDGLLLLCHTELGLATASSPSEHAGIWRRAHMDLSAGAGLSKPEWKQALSQRARKVPTLRRSVLNDLAAELEEGLRGRQAGTPLDRGLTVHYQPIVNLASGVTQGFEALIRWRHPSRGMVSAASLIEAAERTGLIVQLGDWVLSQALTDASALASARSAPHYVSVNVSATQLLEPDFAERTRMRVEAAGLDPSRLVVEITESQIVQDDEHIWEDLADLRNLGVQVAIDDYGTGYASLAYLRHPVIDMLKLDQTFLADIWQPRGRAILQSVIALTDTLEIKLVAEGIEDEVTRMRLLEAGCTLGQGHLYAAAMPLSEAMKWEPSRPVEV